MDALKNQAALNEGKLSSLQVFRPLIFSFFFCVLPIIAYHESLIILVTSSLQLPFSFSPNQLLVKSFTTFIRETWSLLWETENWLRLGWCRYYYNFFHQWLPKIVVLRPLNQYFLLQALREELATTERRAEEERSAHNATKMVCCLNDSKTVYNENIISIFCFTWISLSKTGCHGKGKGTRAQGCGCFHSTC